MSSESDIVALVPHISGLRLLARQVRRLAKGVIDKKAGENLLKHADELDRQAGELEARVEELKRSSKNGGS